MLPRGVLLERIAGSVGVMASPALGIMKLVKSAKRRSERERRQRERLAQIRAAQEKKPSGSIAGKHGAKALRVTRATTSNGRGDDLG